MELIATMVVLTTIFTLWFLLNALRSESTVKKQNNQTQKLNNEVQLLIDDMSPREFYTRKMSQTSLIWDPRTQAYLRKWSKNDTTFH